MHSTATVLSRHYVVISVKLGPALEKRAHEIHGVSLRRNVTLGAEAAKIARDGWTRQEGGRDLLAERHVIPPLLPLLLPPQPLPLLLAAIIALPLSPPDVGAQCLRPTWMEMQGEGGGSV